MKRTTPKKGQRRNSSALPPLQPSYFDAPHQAAHFTEWDRYSRRKRRATCPVCRQRGSRIQELESIVKHYRTLVRFLQNSAKLTIGPAR